MYKDLILYSEILSQAEPIQGLQVRGLLLDTKDHDILWAEEGKEEFWGVYGQPVGTGEWYAIGDFKRKQDALDFVEILQIISKFTLPCQIITETTITDI